MNRNYTCACHTVIAMLLLLLSKAVTAQTFPAGFQAIRIAQNLNPTDMKFSPDGEYLFVSDKSGKLFMAHNDEWHDHAVLNISAQVDPFNERGFNHLAIDPDFNSNGYIYVYFTSTPNGRNKIVRYTYSFSGHSCDPGSAFTLATLDPMTATIHTGGAMNFGLDGKLYVTTGESSNPPFSQSTTSVLGKILRMNKDGSIPEDNPFYNSFTGINRYIYAMGLRNPFTADIQPGTGRYFVCEVGQSLYEEINEIFPGKNYGWSLIEGPKPPEVIPPADYEEPFFYYHHSEGCAIIGGAFYNPAINGFPLQYQGKFFYGDYCNQKIKVLDPGTAQFHSEFASGIGRPVAFAVHPNGAFYYLDRGGIPYQGSEEDNTSTNEGVLWKVVYTGSLVPSVAVNPEPVTVSVGGEAIFGIIVNGLNLSYQWRRNGANIPGANSNVLTITNAQLSDSGALYSCFISNPHGSVLSDAAVLRVTQRPAPVPVITLPANGTTYIAGTTINFTGSAVDPVEGELPVGKLTWKVDFHHDTHTHPVLAIFSGTDHGSFPISPTNEVSDNVWYRIYLTAENNIGIKTTVFRDIMPEKVTLELKAPPGIALSVDGTSTPTPANVLSVKRVVRTISAPTSYMMADTLFGFVRWGNGSTNPQLVFSTPMNDTTINAVYAKLAVWDGTGLVGRYFNLRGTDNFNGSPVLIREDATINFNWGTGSPAPPTVRVDEFSVRWNGFIQPRTSGMYTFFVNSNDGVRLYVNGQLLIDRWNNQSTFEATATMVLLAGLQYSIQLDYFDSFAEAVCELRWSGPAVPKQVIPRASLFTQQSPLPVNFVRFDVRPQGNALLLNWQIEDLGNVKDYAIERSSGNGAFETIGVVPATASSTYSFTDRAVNKNLLYQYRIRQTDFDGRYRYSDIRTGLLSGNTQFDYLVVPNPVSRNQRVQLVFTQTINTASVQVTSVDGKLLINRKSQALSGQTLDLPLDGLSAGTYFIKVIYQGRIITKKVIVY